MKSDLTKSQAETRKMEEEKVEALHRSVTLSLQRLSSGMLDRILQILQISQDISQSAVPQYNWSYYDNKWIKDETLMFE